MTSVRFSANPDWSAHGGTPGYSDNADRSRPRPHFRELGDPTRRDMVRRAIDGEEGVTELAAHYTMHHTEQLIGSRRQMGILFTSFTNSLNVSSFDIDNPPGVVTPPRPAAPSGTS